MSTAPKTPVEVQLPTRRRITGLLAVTRAMLAGQYQVDLPEDTDDDLGQLARTIVDLGRSLEVRMGAVQHLLELTEHINRAVMLDDALEAVWHNFRTVIPYDRLGCSLLDENGAVVRSVWARSTAPKILIEVGYEAPLAGSSLQTIIETGRPRVIDDLTAYLVAHPQSESTRRIVAEGIRSSMTCPLIVVDKPIGFLFFSSCAAGSYSERHIDVFMAIAGQISAIIEKSRLFEELSRAKRALDEANRRLLQLATLDGLTQIPNRRAFDERLGMEWRRAMRTSTRLSLLLIDIDHFKRYNDEFGHLAGDDCLRGVAKSLALALRRPGDFVARYGGEEFAVILPETDERGLCAVARRLSQEVRTLCRDGGSPASISISIGGALAMRGGDDRTAVDLLGRADGALLQAKSRGRDRFCFQGLTWAW